MMFEGRSRALLLLVLASLLMIASTVVAPPYAGAVPAVARVEAPRCHPMSSCLVAIVGSDLDEVIGISASPARVLSVGSRTDTRIEISFPAGQSDALVDLLLHTESGDVVLPDAVHFATGEGMYRVMEPTRIFDTRRADLGGLLPVPANGTVTVPSPSALPGVSNANSYVVNVTAVTPKAAGYLTVHPGDVGRPLASNLNFVAGRTLANLVSVGRASDGSFKITNTSPGSVHVVVDLVGVHVGMFSDSAFGYVPLDPTRAYDSRSDVPFTADGPEDVELGALPPGTRAVALNVTAVGASRSGHVTVFPATQLDPPNVSNINVSSAAPVPNMVIVAADSDGLISVDTNIARVDLVFDVVGVYTGSVTEFVPPAPPFRSTAPTRILDTRNGTGVRQGPLLDGREIVFDVDDLAQVPDDAEAVMMNVTVTGPTTPGYLSVWPGGVPRPLVSSLNFLASQTVANLVLVPIGIDGTVRLYTRAASVHVVADLAGYYSWSGGTPWPGR